METKTYNIYTSTTAFSDFVNFNGSPTPGNTVRTGSHDPALYRNLFSSSVSAKYIAISYPGNQPSLDFNEVSAITGLCENSYDVCGVCN